MENLRKGVAEILSDAKTTDLDKKFAAAVLRVAEDGESMREHQRDCPGCAYCD